MQVALLGFDELESHQLKLCSDMDTFGHSGLDLLCPLSPAVQDELFTPFSPLSGQSPEESLLSSPSLVRPWPGRKSRFALGSQLGLLLLALAGTQCPHAI